MLLASVTEREVTHLVAGTSGKAPSTKRFQGSTLA